MKIHQLTAWALVLILSSVSFAQDSETNPPQPPAPPECLHGQPSFMLTERADWRLRVTGEYLMWWIKDGPAPVPLATSAPATSPTATPGALGNPDTTVVLGGSSIDYPLHHGGRFSAALGLNENLAIEGSYLFLADRSVQQLAAAAGGRGSAFLVNPFFDASTDFETANFLGNPPPTPTAGSAVLINQSRLQGAECNVVGNVLSTDRIRLSPLAGFRFLQLQEGLTLATAQTDPFVAFFPGQFVNTVDQFSTRNNFYGGQLGARLEVIRGSFFMQTAAKVALGGTHEIVNIQGFTNTNTGPDFAAPIPVITVPGGIFALPTNIGVQSRDRLAFVPEATIQAGMNLGQYARAFVGYNFLYLSDVARPANQIDRTIDSRQLPSFTGVPSGVAGVARPSALFNSSDFWAQGINFGLAFDW